MTPTIEYLEYQNLKLAIIIRAGHKEEGVKFYTSDDFSQQMGMICYPAGKLIQPHLHNHIERNVKYTQEVLVIRKGKLKVNFYSLQKKKVLSTVVSTGDVMLLIDGGHGFEVLEDIQMIEIKQGPYLGVQDKVRFD